MSISNPNPYPKDVVILQRDDTNTYYGETHISGTNVIMYIDSAGHLNADYSSSFYATFPPPGGGLVPGNTYPITSSWAVTSSYAETASYAPAAPQVSASWASRSFDATSASFASRSFSSSYSTTASHASKAYQAITSYATYGAGGNASLDETNGLILGSGVIQLNIDGTAQFADGTIFLNTGGQIAAPGITSSLLGTASWARTASFAETASWAPFQVSASWASRSFSSTTASFSSQSFSATSASFASQSFSASYAETASWAPFQVSASWASRSFDTTSASFSSHSFSSTSASFASRSFSASYADTASAATSITFTPDSASFATTASAATSITFIPPSSSYANSASWAVSASYALNGGGGGVSAFTSLTDVPNSYAGYANNVVLVNSASTGLIFGGVPTGVILVYSTTASSEKYFDASIVQTGGLYSKATSQITINEPFQFLSASFYITSSGVYSVYFSTDNSGSSVLYPLALSKSYNIGWQSSSLETIPPGFWFDDVKFFTIENLSTSSKFAFRNPQLAAQRFGTVNSTLFSGITSLNGNYSLAFGFYMYPYSHLGNYGVSGSTVISASYADTASWTPSEGKVIVLCTAYTPTTTGSDAAEIPIPYNPSDGITPLSWSVSRINFRAQTSESISSSLMIEKSTSTGSFSAVSLGSITLSGSLYETFTGSSGTIISGDKLRFNVSTLGTAQNWTVTVEIKRL